MGKYLESKPRFEILDGLRGVAALMVIAFHLGEVYMQDYRGPFVNHGYMAVDFFFALSGFVLGYAYDDRWDRMSAWDFAKRRLTRLHPMVVFGLLVGVVTFYFQGCDDFPLVDQTSVGELMICFLLGLCMIPMWPGIDIRGTAEMSDLNGPIWSLMYEYFANFCYALVLRRLPKVAMWILLGMSALMTIDVVGNVNVTGLLDNYATPYCNQGGWAVTPEGLYLGMTRLFFPFLAGLMLSRMGWTMRMKGAFVYCSLAIVVLLGMPFLGNGNPLLESLYNMSLIFVVFPLLVSVAAGSTVSGKRMSQVCKFFGELSFPIYITHYPLVWMQHAWVRNHPDAPVASQVLVAVGVVLAAVFVSYAALKLYDEPVREWLKNNWLKKKSA